MYFSKLYSFVLLSKPLNVLGGTYFLVYDLLTPFSHACIIESGETDPKPVCLFIVCYAYHDRGVQILSNFRAIPSGCFNGTRTAMAFQKILAFIGIILVVRFFWDST